MKQPGETEPQQAGPSFDHALRAGLNCGVLVFNGATDTATLTPEAKEILGLPKSSAPELPVRELPPELTQLARDVVRSGKPATTQALALKRNRRAETVWASAVPIKSSTSSLCVLTLHAINTSSEFFERIRQLDRLANAGTLAAGMAHEIKNALVAGRTFLDLLLEKNSDEDLVQIVRRETGRIDAIVSRMLHFAGTNDRSMNRLHVHQVLDQVLRLVQPQLAANSISLEKSFQASRDAIRADEFELHQAFVNLVLNAIEAMGAGGKLRVSTDVMPAAGAQSNIEIQVGDSGPGILPEHLDRLFEPFFTTKAAGTGLGLAVTKRIVQEHGGAISVRSQSGQGTTFAIALPLLSEAEKGTQPGGLAAAAFGGKSG